MSKSSKIKNAIVGTVAGLGLLLATSCSTPSKMTSTYGSNSQSAVIQTEQSSAIPVRNDFTDFYLNNQEEQQSDVSEFGTRVNAKQAMTETELRELRDVLYPVNTNMNIGARNLYLKPNVDAKGDTINFTMGVVSDDYKCTEISKEDALRLLAKKPVVPQKVVGDKPLTGEPVDYKKRNFGIGISPEYRFENNSSSLGLSADMNIFNFLFTVKSPSLSSDFNKQVHELANYSRSDFPRVDGPKNLTYVLTETQKTGDITQDFGWGFGAGYQVPIGNFRLGLTGNMQNSNVSISNSSEELSKKVYSTFTNDFIKDENASLLPKETNTTDHSGWYVGGNLRASYVFNNGFEIGAKGGLMVPLSDMKEFDFNNSTITTKPTTNGALMIRYNF